MAGNHHFEAILDLHDGHRPEIEGHGSAFAGYDGQPGMRVAYVRFGDRASRVTMYLSIDQAEAAGRLLLDLARRTRALPEPEQPSGHHKVPRTTAWPPAAEVSNGQ